MICSNCGKELPDTAKFCGGCGQSFQESPAQTQAEATTVEQPTLDAAASTSVEKTAESPSAGSFVAAGSGSNPFASLGNKLNEQLSKDNESVNVSPFSGTYAKSEEAESIAEKARKSAEERASARAALKEKTEKRRGKKPVIAGFAEEPESDERTSSPLASSLPNWDLVPASSFMVNRSAS